MLFVKSKKQHIKKGYVSFQIMPAKRKSVLILSILLFSLISNVQASNDFDTVPQFGTGFEEVVIADSSDDLFDPRDLEFHPGRANELWIANRGDDSITIVHNTGLENQYSEIPHSVLQKISTRITNTVKGAVNRVVYDITHKPPGTIEWE